jgi:hypothetical protein
VIKFLKSCVVVVLAVLLWGCSSSSSTPAPAGSTGTLPSSVSGQVVSMRFGAAQASAPYSNDDLVEFTFSSSGLLMLDNATFASSFTTDSSGGSTLYIWDNGTARLELSLINDAINEVNVFDSANAASFLGQFTPVVPLDLSLVGDLAGVYNVSQTNTGTHARGSVTIDAQGGIDFDTGLSFPLAAATEFFDRSNLAVPLKRLAVGYGAFNGFAPNATLSLYLDSNGVLVRITLESEPNVTLVTDVEL